MVGSRLLASEEGGWKDRRPALWRGFEVLGHVEDPRGACQLTIRPGEGALFLMLVAARARPRTAKGPAPASAGELASAIIRFAQECLFSIPGPSLRRLDPGALLVDLDAWLADSGLGQASAVAALLESRGLAPPESRPDPSTAILGHVRGARVGAVQARILSIGPKPDVAPAVEPGFFELEPEPVPGGNPSDGRHPGFGVMGFGEVLPRSFGVSLTSSSMLLLTGGVSEVEMEPVEESDLEAELEPQRIKEDERAAGGSRAARSRLRTAPAPRALISCRPVRRQRPA